MKTTILFIFFLTIGLHAQNSNIGNRVNNGELKMTFPSIYFKHNSTEYASSPLRVDSCFRHIAIHFNETSNSLVIWRDSVESEELTNKRIKKIKSGLSKYTKEKEIEIHSMREEQKISRRSIEMSVSKEQKEYLLTLNSVFDISKTRFPNEKTSKTLDHIIHPKIWCWRCWITGFHNDKRGRAYRKTYKLSQQTNVEQPKKVKRLPCWMNLRLNKTGRKRCKMERLSMQKK